MSRSACKGTQRIQGKRVRQEKVMPVIVMTGGGTAGHVTPNIALMPALKEAGFEIYYIGSYNGEARKQKYS